MSSKLLIELVVPGLEIVCAPYARSLFSKVSNPQEKSAGGLTPGKELHPEAEQGAV